MYITIQVGYVLLLKHEKALAWQLSATSKCHGHLSGHVVRELEHTQGKRFSYNNVAPQTPTSSSRGRHHISGHENMPTSVCSHLPETAAWKCLLFRSLHTTCPASTNTLTLQETRHQHMEQELNATQLFPQYVSSKNARKVPIKLCLLWACKKKKVNFILCIL